MEQHHVVSHQSDSEIYRIKLFNHHEIENKKGIVQNIFCGIIVSSEIFKKVRNLIKIYIEIRKLGDFAIRPFRSIYQSTLGAFEKKWKEAHSEASWRRFVFRSGCIELNREVVVLRKRVQNSIPKAILWSIGPNTCMLWLHFLFSLTHDFLHPLFHSLFFRLFGRRCTAQSKARTVAKIPMENFEFSH